MVNIKKNDAYTMEITGMTHEGQGVGRIDGFTVFVDNAIEGETAEVKIIKVTTSYAVGKLMRILTPSPDRIAPFCGAYVRCGGCSLQHLSYEAQLRFKTGVVRESLKRIGKLEDVVVHDTIGMQNALNYRNKSQCPVGMAKGAPAAGFYAQRTHEIVDCDTCGIQSGISDRVRAAVKAWIIRNNISVYDEAAGKGLIRHVMTRVGFTTGEVMVVMVVNGKELPAGQQLVDTIVSTIPGVKSIVLNVNTQNTNIILGDRNINLYGKGTITDTIGRYKFEISPLSFFQVNPIQTEVLYGKALEYAGLTGKETVFDLYCGIGTISLFLSERAKKVYGVEVLEDAVKDAKRNAALNGVENVEFMAGEVEKVIPGIYRQGVRADVVVVDPPRKGCDEVTLQTLVDMAPDRMVYVSCKPSTLARDLKFLAEKGYRAVEVQPVDMFPWTAHVENVSLVKRTC